MKLSLTPRRTLIFGSIAAAAIIWFYVGQSPDEPTGAVARAAGATARTGSLLPRQGGTALSANAAEFLTRLAHRTTDSKTAGALFASKSWYVAPPPPPPAPPVHVVPPPPTAPPLPFTFIGSYAVQGDQTTYFVARGERIYDVKMGAVIDDDYTLVAVDAANMIFNYRPLNAHQSLALGGTP